MKRTRSISPLVYKSSFQKLDAPGRTKTPFLNLSAPPSTSTSDRNCLCHVYPFESKDFTLFTRTTWATFKSAAEIREDKIASDMHEKWNQDPVEGYHKRCYRTYIQTNRNLPGSAFCPLSVDDKENLDPHFQKNSSIETENKILSKGACVVCGSSERKRIRRGTERCYERVELCQTQEAWEKMKDCAILRNDLDKIRVLSIRGDLVAGISWHMSCYRNYTHNTLPSDDKPGICRDKVPFERAYTKLYIEVHNNIIENGNIHKLADIKDRYIALLSEEGVVSPYYSTQKVKKNIMKKFGDSIQTCLDHSKGAEYVFSSKARIIDDGLLWERGIYNIDSSTPTVSKDMPEPEYLLFHCAKLIRSKLRAQDSSLPKLPKSVDITEKNIKLPTMVYNFLAWIITENSDPGTEKVVVPEKDNTRILSIGQDLLFGVSNGRILTPKHLGLSYTVRNITGSAEVVRLLNKFGHGVSYTALLNHETNMDEQIRNKNTVQIPTNIKPGTQITCVWDNIDFAEETLGGQGTTHKTNGIILQEQALDSSEAIPQTIPNAEHPPLSNELLTYYQTPRKGLPRPIELYDPGLIHYTCPTYKAAEQLDNLWFLLRLPLHDGTVFEFGDTEQTVPGWSAFNHIVRKESTPKQTTVGYCQMIDESPTQLSTVYTAMKQSQEMARQTGQAAVDIVFDQAIYCKALEIQFARGQEFDNVVVRLGPLHTIFMYLNVLGKRFGDAGFSDVVIESNIIASGSIAGVLNGHHYNRAIRVHKLFMEACERVRWKEFGRWLSQHAAYTDLPTVYNEIKATRDDLNKESIENLKDSPQLKQLLDLYQDFVKLPRGPMDEFWDSYIDMVRLLIKFNRSIREGNWSLNKHCCREIIPWADAYDCRNYSRYLPVHYLQMVNLPKSHPTVHSHLERNFAVQRSTTNAFGKVAEDMAIEQTVNKSTKGQGGIKGFTLNDRAVQRWISTAPERAAITENTKKMAGLLQDMDDQHVPHKEMTKPRIKKDEDAVRAIVDKLENVVVNPYKESSEIVSLTSGIVAPPKVESDLLNAKSIGEKSVNETIQKRLLSLEINFHSPMPKHNLGTFSSLTKYKSKSKSDHKLIELKADRGLFARLLVIARQRDINLGDVLSYELGPLPLSLSTVFGTLQKTTKSALFHVLLQQGDSLLLDVPSHSPVLIDMMALLQRKGKSACKTFGSLAETCLKEVCSIDTERVDLVCDQYPLISIKNAEREARACTGVLVTRIVSAEQKVEQFSKFLKHGQNKENLVKFLFTEWQKDKYAELIGEKTIVLSHQEEAHIIKSYNGKVCVQLCQQLCTKQEEADTRLLLHAHDCSERNYKSVIIRSDDTDVLILAIYHQWDIKSRLIIETSGPKKLIDVKALSKHLGKPVSRALLPYHALTGCDSVSAFSGRGKKGGFDILKTEKRIAKNLTSLGEHLPLSEATTEKTETFVCRIYGYNCKSANTLRFEMFTAPLAYKKGPPDTQMLPPTSDALHKHIQRANYQTYVWKNALNGNIDIPSPSGHGWLISDGKLTIDWMNSDPAPKALLENISCGCATDCSSKQCSCKKLGFQCTDACHCTEECINLKAVAEETDSGESCDESENDIDMDN